MKRPNILIVMSDQQQADVLAPGHACHTPHADRLAAQGLRFTHCYTPTAHCCPSRASFHTRASCPADTACTTTSPRTTGG